MKQNIQTIVDAFNRGKKYLKVITGVLAAFGTIVIIAFNM